jgi:hypothetical protein
MCEVWVKDVLPVYYNYCKQALRQTGWQSSI